MQDSEEFHLFFNFFFFLRGCYLWDREDFHCHVGNFTVTLDTVTFVKGVLTRETLKSSIVMLDIVTFVKGVLTVGQ